MNRKVKAAVCFLGFLLIWFFIAPFLARNLIVEKTLESADAILVLSGGSAFVERTHRAAQLFKQGVAPKIFLTNDGVQGGWNRQEQTNIFFYEQARRELINQGVPAENIEVLPEIVEGTHDEAVLFEKIVRERNLKSILLVTSAYHTQRTLSTFQKVFGDKAEIGIAAPEIGIAAPEIPTPSPYYWWLFRQGWRNVALEYLKIFYYWLYY